uniref:Uncharacterized protein n=1 Tax=Poecilia reticulata TaxID=8081 RepID=A0A3P9PN62_POERE
MPLCIQLQDSRVVRSCSFNLGAAYVEAGRPQRGLDLLRRNRPGPKAERLPDLQFNTALAHNALGQYQEAAAHFLRAAQLYRSQGDGGSEGELYLSVGVAYCRIRCFQEAVASLRRAVEPAARRPPLLAKVLHNLGAALNAAGDFSSALEWHRLAAQLYGSQGCRGDQARCFSNLAIASSHLGDDQEAAESFILALQGFRDTGDRLAEVQVCERLAECYLRQEKLQKAVELYKQALSALAHCKVAHLSHLEVKDTDTHTHTLQPPLQQPQAPPLQAPPLQAPPLQAPPPCCSLRVSPVLLLCFGSAAVDRYPDRTWFCWFCLEEQNSGLGPEEPNRLRTAEQHPDDAEFLSDGIQPLLVVLVTR